MRSLRSILLTGGAGFIGSNLARHLLADSRVERLVVLDRLTGTGSRGNLIGPDQDPRFVFVEGDIANQELVSHLLDTQGVTGLFNLAANTAAHLSDPPSDDLISTNIAGSKSILDAARRAAVPVLQCSTDEVYGSIASPGKSTEESPLLPESLYAASKASADLLCLSASTNARQDIVITRSSSNYGPRQPGTEIIPSLVSRAVHNQALILSESGTNIHDWIHVDDHCRGLIMAFAHGPSGHIFNFGGNCERTNLGIARSILTVFGKPESLLDPGSGNSARSRRSAVDAGKALRYFSWTPKCSFQAWFPTVVRELAADLAADPCSAASNRWLPRSSG